MVWEDRLVFSFALFFGIASSSAAFATCGWARSRLIAEKAQRAIDNKGLCRELIVVFVCFIETIAVCQFLKAEARNGTMITVRKWALFVCF